MPEVTENTYLIEYFNRRVACDGVFRIKALSSQVAVSTLRGIYTDGEDCYVKPKKVYLLTDMDGEWV